MKWFLLLFFGLTFNVYGQQNLVPNPSFEEFSGCPEGPTDINNLMHWGHYFSANYFNECGTNGWNVPQNIFGFQQANQGEGYVGIYNYSQLNSLREYVWVELKESLQAEEYYWIKFHISMSDSIWYATKNIGAYLSSEVVEENRDTLLQLKPQVVYTGEEFLNNKASWTEISGRFKAEGGEKYMIIGNFDDDANTDTSFVPGGGAFRPNQPYYFASAYYYVDDVSVVLDTTTSIKEAENFSLRVYPNPNDGNMYLEYAGLAGDATFEMYDVMGRKVTSYQLQGEEGKINISEEKLESGLYTYRILNTNQVVKKGKVVINR